ncbi:MAG: aspartate aminotransferase family protein [Firmicutes bacterium HGW-Firmicutes-21]|nr:MAG: aspartate aminotransferase family protein [Firmicutes bacterium HGW-Firmicutes-21]
MSIITDTDKYIAQSYGRFPVAIKSGKGSLLYDTDDKEYIDMGSGIAVNAFGASDKTWVEAVTAQLGQIAHTSNLYYSLPQARLAELLCEGTHFEKVFFCNSGAEANECAIKAARKYSSDKYGEGRSGIVTLRNSFHGRTVTTLSATGQDSFHTHFHPFTEGFSYAEANDFADTAEKAGDNCAAVMIELIQGEGGINVLDKEYVTALAELCGKKDILLIVDEVQTGNGRTGKRFCYEHYGIKPDIITTAKGLGGGLPIGATLLGEKTANTLTPGTHGSTFGGNPVCAAGAISIIERIDSRLLEEVTEKSEYIKERLLSSANVTEVAGIGLMLGVKTAKEPKVIVDECIKRGLLTLTAKDKVRLLPALNIPLDLLERGINILMEVLEK